MPGSEQTEPSATSGRRFGHFAVEHLNILNVSICYCVMLHCLKTKFFVHALVPARAGSIARVPAPKRRDLAFSVEKPQKPPGLKIGKVDPRRKSQNALCTGCLLPAFCFGPPRKTGLVLTQAGSAFSGSLPALPLVGTTANGRSPSVGPPFRRPQASAQKRCSARPIRQKNRVERPWLFGKRNSI